MYFYVILCAYVFKTLKSNYLCTVKPGLTKWTLLILPIFLIFSCQNKPTPAVSTSAGFKYEAFRDSLLIQQADTTHDSTNLFDANLFVPGKDSLDPMLVKMDSLLHREYGVITGADSLISHIRRYEVYSPEEKLRIRENVRTLDSFLMFRDSMSAFSCKGKDCLLYAEVVKSVQTLYLYIYGELKDSFKVSTGIKKYETPVMNTRPAGPVLTKYTSRKFPGGNYKGLGNMPYVVFIRGGYGIHGTTPGNFSKLGTRASHGCIRLHPDNARVFNELVKLFGLDHTWVVVKDSL